MNSPFPGMDPFIEACGLWEDFHEHLIDKISEDLAETIPEHYRVRSARRSYVVLVEPQGKVRRHFLPDVSVTKPRGRKRAKGGGGIAVAPLASQGMPVAMRACIEEEHRETFVEIYQSGPEQRLVTTIEVLSPSNKNPSNSGWDLYQRKRQTHLLGNVNLVEIDLLRGGKRMPMLDAWPESPYSALMARANRAQLCEVWPMYFDEPLPPIPVPLAPPDADVPLQLQPLIETIYQRFRYWQDIDYKRSLRPALNAKELAWLKQRLRQVAKDAPR